MPCGRMASNKDEGATNEREDNQVMIDPIEIAKSRLTFDHLIPWDKIPVRIVAIARCDMKHREGMWYGYYHTDGLKPSSMGYWESEVLRDVYGGHNPYWESLWEYYQDLRVPIGLRWDEHLFLRPSVTQEKRIAELEARITVLELQLKEP